MEPGVGKQELDALFVDQRPVLVRMLAKVVGCANLAEDLAQEAYLRVAQALPGRHIEHLRPFLYQTAQHLAFDHLRSQRSKRRFEFTPDDDQQLATVPAPSPDRNPMPRASSSCASCRTCSGACPSASSVYSCSTACMACRKAPSPSGWIFRSAP